MRILITGGFGFVGGRLAEYLRDKGCQVVLSTRISQERRISGHNNTEVLITDWESDGALRAICEKIDVIVHTAGMNARDCAADPIAALQFNGVATLRLLKAARAASVQRLIYISTAHVYGSPMVGRIDENTLPKPLHPYATSHRAAEDVILAADCSGWLTGVVLRLSNAFGRPARPEADCWDLLFNNLCRQAVSSSVLRLKGSGVQRRNFIAMEDVCAAVHHILTVPVDRLGTRLLNLGSEWSPTIYEGAKHVVDLFYSITGVKLEIQLGAATTGETSNPLDYVSDALRSIGFKPKQNHHQELKELIHYCLQQFRISDA